LQKKRSNSNVFLYNEIQINGYSRAICNKTYINEIYQELNFDNENINELDSEIKNLKNLKFLSLNRNSLKKISNIPPNLKELSIYYNFTNAFGEKIFQENLVFLGLGYNSLTDETIGSLNNFCFSLKTQRFYF